MKKNVSRRNWLKKLTAGAAGLVIAEKTFGQPHNIEETKTSF